MYPPFASSRVMTSLRIVVLPDPLGPMRVTRSPLRTTKSRSWRTTWSPKRFSTLSKRIAGVSPSGIVMLPVCVALVAVFKSFLQSANEHRGRIARNEVDDAGHRDRFGVAEVLAAEDLRGTHEFHNGDRQ